MRVPSESGVYFNWGTAEILFKRRPKNLRHFPFNEITNFLFSNLLDTTEGQETVRSGFLGTILFISLGLFVGLLTAIIFYLKLRRRRPRLPGNQSKLTNRVAFGFGRKAFREFKKLRQVFKRKLPIKIQLPVKLSVLRLFHSKRTDCK